MRIKGTDGDDTLTGTDTKDTFDLTQGGNDTVFGLGGRDTFLFGSTFTAADSVDGGSGHDTIVLDGDYSEGVAFLPTTMVNVERIELVTGHAYSLILDDANVAAGATLAVDDHGNGFALYFDGSQERDGNFSIKTAAVTTSL